MPRNVHRQELEQAVEAIWSELRYQDDLSRRTEDEAKDIPGFCTLLRRYLRKVEDDWADNAAEWQVNNTKQVTSALAGLRKLAAIATRAMIYNGIVPRSQYAIGEHLIFVNQEPEATRHGVEFPFVYGDGVYVVEVLQPGSMLYDREGFHYYVRNGSLGTYVSEDEVARRKQTTSVVDSDMRGWVFSAEGDAIEEVGFALASEYVDADAAMTGFGREFAAPFDVYFRDGNGELQATNAESTPDDFH